MNRPQHPQTKAFLRQKLFHGLSSFRELESRISALKTNKERGDAFEVFAEAYLATQPIAQVKHVWPFDAIPLPIKARFALDTGIDMGVDGIAETHTDQYHAYQVKFRVGRPSIRWGELSTFMGLTDKVAQRLLFTNCDDLPPLMNERTGFYCIRGSDLDRLGPRDFESILGRLEGIYVAKEKKEPKSHQVEALDTILPAFERYDRVTTVMACGSGKTLLALWTAERMDCGRVLVLVPALALLRQTLHEWLTETHWERLSYLCVCSDPTVKKNIDDLIVRHSDLDFPVSTDSQTVAEFLAREFDGVQVVFSTYQSARVVAEGMDKASPFELGIFDEAHKTAGREGVNFSFALKDENLPIRKRLFMTATPRHYDVRKKDKEGDSKLNYSMDVPEVYGRVVHKLWFTEAARRDIICNYKVLISIVTSEMVNDELFRRGEVIVDGDPVKARHVANQIALQKAFEKHGVRKIITFHRTVTSAKSFTQPGSEDIRNHLPDFEAYHVNGAMPTAYREGLMTAFQEVERGIMSNARCLTEGIDVPAVDMVAFLTPKRSRVDIVQATGRAMRKEKGKTTGYVLLPLFVQQATEESIEEAIERAEFDEVWNVLQAMQEQDDVLADIIRQMREECGRTGGYDDTRFREKVEFLGPQILLDTLRESISTMCIEKLGSPWDERYGELKAFWEQYGHCYVPWTRNPKLGKWVQHQRTFQKKAQLNKERIRRLNEIGFVWDTFVAAWEEMFSELVEFKKTHGHCNVPQRWSENHKLGKWVFKQRQKWNRCQLSEERIRRLEDIGFIWDPLKAFWEEMFLVLAEFKKTHGHCNVPQCWAKNLKLANWVRSQRNRYKKGQLNKESIQRLEELGFQWDPLEASWEEFFSALVKFKGVHSHCNVPTRWPENPKLFTWVSNQRSNWKKGQLSEERIRRLNEIGFIWDTREASWEVMFSELVEFQEIQGHCNVPPSNWPENPKLGRWVNTQRTSLKKGQLSREHILRLNEIGFVWDTLAAAWEEMFSELVEFKKTHGHCNVPKVWLENPRLGNWVSTQRRFQKKGQLGGEHVRRLDELGFQWESRRRLNSKLK